MPWKLKEGEETVRVEIKVPKSMKDWLDKREGGASRYLRKVIRARMQMKGLRDESDDSDLVT